MPKGTGFLLIRNYLLKVKLEQDYNISCENNDIRLVCRMDLVKESVNIYCYGTCNCTRFDIVRFNLLIYIFLKIDVVSQGNSFLNIATQIYIWTNAFLIFTGIQLTHIYLCKEYSLDIFSHLLT